MFELVELVELLRFNAHHDSSTARVNFSMMNQWLRSRRVNRDFHEMNQWLRSRRVNRDFHEVPAATTAVVAQPQS